MTDIVFLPGASGRREYWEPVAVQLSVPGKKILLGWPGFRDEPADSQIKSLSDLADYVILDLKRPVDLVAQSMGGVVALTVSLRQPDLVRRLVLAGTSGGLDMAQFSAVEWQRDYLREIPETAPRWFVDEYPDLTSEIPSMSTPALLLWGEDDLTSPPAVGRYLASLLPHAEFISIPEAGHMVAEEQPAIVASLVQRFLEAK